jgi:phosphodiester glycosidase
MHWKVYERFTGLQARVAGRMARRLSSVLVRCCTLATPSLLGVLNATPARAQRPETAVDTVAPGIVHTALVRADGPWYVHVVAIDLRRGQFHVEASRAHDSLFGRERTSDMVRRAETRGEHVVAAVNADFFDLRGTGANENNQVIGGRVLKAVPVTDSPFDTFRNAHSQFAIDGDGKPHIERFVYAGALVRRWGVLCFFRLFCNSQRIPLDGVNGVPRTSDALVLFTDAYGNAPRVDSSRVANASVVVELPLERDGDRWIPTEAPHLAKPSALSSGMGMLVAYGPSARSRLDSLWQSTGGSFSVDDAFLPNFGRLSVLVGGWPRLLVDGESVAARADSLEGTFPRFSTTRHPRSGIGFSRDSTTLYLITVDGRQESSDGMSLVEFAEEMKRDGVWNGLNLDGGGSTTLVIRGRLANKPSDPSGERAVGNAILIVEGRR